MGKYEKQRYTNHFMSSTAGKSISCCSTLYGRERLRKAQTEYVHGELLSATRYTRHWPVLFLDCSSSLYVPHARMSVASGWGQNSIESAGRTVSTGIDSNWDVQTIEGDRMSDNYNRYVI
jgi:hypothetical protein